MAGRQPSHPEILVAGGARRQSTTQISPSSPHPSILQAGSESWVQSPVEQTPPEWPTPEISTSGSSTVGMKEYFPDQRHAGFSSASNRRESYSQAKGQSSVSSVVSPISNSSPGSLPGSLQVSPPEISAQKDSRSVSTSHNHTTNERLSQLFQRTSTPSSSNNHKYPDRPPSAASSIRASSQAIPSVLLPAEPKTMLSHAPPPPSFPSDTSYRPHYLQSPSFGSAGKPSRSVSIYKAALGRLRSSRQPGRSPYESVREVDEEDYGNTDLGSLGGAFPLHPVVQPQPQPQLRSGARDQSTIQEQGEYAYEFHQLEAAEAQGKLTGGLGQGMLAARTFEFNPEASRSAAIGSDGYRGGLNSNGATSVVDTGQQKAIESGQMVIINEAGLGVDIGTWGGGVDEESGTRPDGDTASLRMSNQENKQSYFFPPDKSLNWKPFSMRWPFILSLVVLSFGLGALQEYVCQRSIALQNETPKNGLLKFKTPAEVSTAKYFVWKYLPIIVAVLYGVLWQIVDFEVKRLEPYYQLSRDTGATAAESLNIDYLTFWAYLSPLKAIKYKQWAVLSCSVAALLAQSIVPTLQSASVNLSPKPQGGISGLATEKYVTIDPVWSRILTATLVIVGSLGCCLLFQLRRTSGLLSDPKGIAGVAAMATKSHILMDFKGLDEESPEAIHKRLRHRRYILHKSSLWQGAYIKQSDLDKQDHRHRNRFDQFMHRLKVRLHLKADTPQNTTLARQKENPHPLMLRLKAGIPFIVFMCFIFAFVPAILFTKAFTFSYKAPWFFTALATAIKLIWSTLECDVRMMEPFYILSNRHAPPETLTLDYTGTIPIWMPIKALMNGHFLLSLVGMCAVLTEILTVCMSAVGSARVSGLEYLPAQFRGETQTGETAPPSGEESFRSYWASFLLSMTILIILVCTATIVYAARRHPFLPRIPGTIASVLAYIHQSKMLYDFVDTETFDEKKMNFKLRSLGKRYGLGWFRGRDGEEHCGVDEEELLANYQHGQPYRDAVTPWRGGDISVF